MRISQPFLENEDCKVVILAHAITAPSSVVETVRPLQQQRADIGIPRDS